MNNHLRKGVALLLSVTLALGLFGCAKTPAVSSSNPFPGTADADCITIDISTDPAELNHLRLSDGVSVDPLRHFMSGLTRLDKNDDPVADLAERWEIDGDNTVYTMYLRKDAKWTNGDSVTAHDFYYSWMKQMDTATGSLYAAFLYSNLLNGEDYYNGKVGAEDVGLEVLDDYTLRITWSEPMASALYLMAFPPFFPMNQKAYESIGDDKYGKSPDTFVTNGAYSLTEWVPGDHITLEKNPDYWNAATIAVPKLKLVMIGDQNTRLNAFLAGEVDVCSLYSDQIEQIKAEGPDALRSYIDGVTWYFEFNQKNEWLSNVNLRRALSYSVDVQNLLDNVIRDGSVAADGFVPDVIAGVGETSYADARGSLFAYDPEAAKGYFETALRELGVTEADIKLELLTSDSSYSQTQAAFIQQEWKNKLGLDVGIRVLPWKARVEAQSSGDYDMVSVGWGPAENDAMTFLTIFPSDSPYNYCGYSSQEYDSLIAQANEEPDPQKRQENMIAAEKTLIADMAIGPLYFTSTAYAVSAKVDGLTRTPFQIFNFCDGAKIIPPAGG